MRYTVYWYSLRRCSYSCTECGKHVYIGKGELLMHRAGNFMLHVFPANARRLADVRFWKSEASLRR